MLQTRGYNSQFFVIDIIAWFNLLCCIDPMLIQSIIGMICDLFDGNSKPLKIEPPVRVFSVHTHFQVPSCIC